jgi:rod shape-determining protein MreC
LLLSRRISEHRSTVILLVLVVLSLASLASGAHAGFIRKGIRVTVTAVSYPFLVAIQKGQDALSGSFEMITDYDAARKEAVTLRQQLGTAMQHSVRRQILESENQRLRRMLNFARSEPRLSMQPSEVIGLAKGILIIDRGSAHGLRPSLCAMTERGVIGFLKEVDPFTASVVTLHNIECKVGAMIRRNHVRGMIHGRGSDLSPVCTMEYIDLKDDVRLGDEVVTSPESKFPAGYLIGQITALHETGAMWKTADVRPTADIDRVDELFILIGSTPSAEELSGFASRAPAPAPPTVPEEAAKPDPKKPEVPQADPGTLQEVYAP